MSTTVPSAAAAATAATTASKPSDISPTRPSHAVSAQNNDVSDEKRLHVIHQLTSVFSFNSAIAEQAIEAVGADVAAACDYIIDSGLGKDQGGAVVPIETCPHVEAHVKLQPPQLPANPHNAICNHHEEYDNSNPSTCIPVGRAKSVTQEDGRCPPGENWLCLECGVVRCSRYVNGHGVAHWEDTCKEAEDGVGHCIAASLADFSVWCHVCGSYLRHPCLDPLLKNLEELKFHGEPDRKKARSEQPQHPNLELHHPHPASQSSDDDCNSSAALSAYSETLADLITTAAARGIPVELFLNEHQTIEDDDDIEYPFGHLPTSLKDVATFIQSDNCHSVVILAGAGMSVASGIPDFRSANGLYATMNPDLLTADSTEREAIRMDPTVALEQGMFLQNPFPCLELNRSFILGTRDQKWKATLAHRFVELLHSKTGKLVRLYTQNIDGLEDQCTELPRDKVVAVHGSMDRAECARCGEQVDFNNFCDSVQKQIKDVSGEDPAAPKESTPIKCPSCGNNSLKPAIVLFRSSLPTEFFERIPEDVVDVDLFIVIGTSLRVAPANSLVWRVPKTAMRLVVNREPVGWHLGIAYGEEAKRDYFAEGDCDAVLIELMSHLGWLDDLKPLLDGKLPKSCENILKERLEQEENGNKSKAG